MAPLCRGSDASPEQGTQDVLVALGHAGQQWHPQGCAAAVTLPNQSQALGCKSTRGDSEKETI